MWTLDEFKAQLAIAEKPIGGTALLELLSILQSYTAEFFSKPDLDRKALLAAIIDQCSMILEQIPLAERNQISINDFKIKYPGMMQVFSLQQQAVREYYLPEIHFKPKAHESFSEMRSRFLTQSRWALLKAPFAGGDRALRVPYWPEKRFGGYPLVAESYPIVSWLNAENSEGRNILSFSEMMAQQSPLAYLENPNAALAKIQDGKIKITSKGKLKDLDHQDMPKNTINIYGPNTFIYVMDNDGHLFIYHNEIPCPRFSVFHHSSFLKGQPVRSAGTLTVEDGRLTRITVESGHYQTTPKNILNCLKVLQEQGIDLSQTKLVYTFGGNEVNAIDYMHSPNNLTITDEAESVQFLFAAMSELSSLRKDGSTATSVKENLQNAITHNNPEAMMIYAIELYHGRLPGDKSEAITILKRVLDKKPQQTLFENCEYFFRWAHQEAVDILYQEWAENPQATDLLEAACHMGDPRARLARATMLMNGTNGYDQNKSFAISELNAILKEYDQCKDLIKIPNVFITFSEIDSSYHSLSVQNILDPLFLAHGVEPSNLELIFNLVSNLQHRPDGSDQAPLFQTIHHTLALCANTLPEARLILNFSVYEGVNQFDQNQNLAIESLKTQFLESTDPAIKSWIVQFFVLHDIDFDKITEKDLIQALHRTRAYVQKQYVNPKEKPLFRTLWSSTQIGFTSEYNVDENLSIILRKLEQRQFSVNYPLAAQQALDEIRGNITTLTAENPNIQEYISQVQALLYDDTRQTRSACYAFIKNLPKPCQSLFVESLNNMLFQQLMKAIHDNDTSTFQEIINTGMNIQNRIDGCYEGLTALGLACRLGRTAMVSALIKADVDLNQAGDPNNNEHEIFDLAQCTTQADDIIEALVKAGKDINQGRWLLWLACGEDDQDHQKVQKLLNWGADVEDSVSPGYSSPLTAAIQKGNLKTLELLITHGANIQKRTDHVFPLRVAIENGNASAVKLLLDYGADPHTTFQVDGSSKIMTLDMLAKEQGNPNIIVMIQEALKLKHEESRARGKPLLHYSLLDDKKTSFEPTPESPPPSKINPRK